jgi:bifunctional non-homologous end joining protein LigD
MPLGRRREPFDHPEWFFEVKWDGFRALAYITGGGAATLVSCNGDA